MKTRTLFAAALLVLTATVVVAAGGGGGSSGGGYSSGGAEPSEASARDPVIQAAKDGIAKEDWLATQALLRQALVSQPDNADYHNLYAFTTRKGPNADMALVFAEYETALRIDPKHKGALEYLGEAYLQTDNLAKAKEQLAKLDRICFFPCEEFTDLKRAVRAYEVAHPQ